MSTIKCAHCGRDAQKATSAVNRANREGKRLFCSKACAGFGRRSKKAEAQKKEEKRLYDMEYRAQNLQSIKERKRAYFERTYDPAKAADERKKKMHAHVEYCRRPEYKAYKKKYDEQYRANKLYGEFYESFLILQRIDQEVAKRASKYEIMLENGTINKAQTRRRNYERTFSNES